MSLKLYSRKGTLYIKVNNEIIKMEDVDSFYEMKRYINRPLNRVVVNINNVKEVNSLLVGFLLKVHGFFRKNTNNKELVLTDELYATQEFSWIDYLHDLFKIKVTKTKR